MTDDARQTDVDFMQRSAKLATIWVIVILAAGVGLLAFGDTLMNAFV